jgi:hypothetical protein
MGGHRDGNSYRGDKTLRNPLLSALSKGHKGNRLIGKAKTLPLMNADETDQERDKEDQVQSSDGGHRNGTGYREVRH